MLTVSRISITPVRGLGLQHPDRVELGWHGVERDRRYMLQTLDSRIFDGTKFGPLVQIGAEVAGDPERLTLRFPSGDVVTGTVELGHSAVVEAYGRRFTARRVIGPWAASVSEYAGRQLQLVRSERRLDEPDRHAVSVVSDASVLELSRQANGGTPLNARRFRMLIHVAGASPHEEDSWLGTDVRIGEATVRPTMPVARCVVVTHDPSTGHRDFRTLHAIKAYRGLREGNKVDFGIYADVVTPGTLRVGDPVRLGL